MAGLLPWTSYLVSAWELNVDQISCKEPWLSASETNLNFFGELILRWKICLGEIGISFISASVPGVLGTRAFPQHRTVAGKKIGTGSWSVYSTQVTGRSFWIIFYVTFHPFSIFHRNSHQLGTPNFTFQISKKSRQIFEFSLISAPKCSFFLVKVSARYPAGAGLYPRTKLGGAPPARWV